MTVVLLHGLGADRSQPLTLFGPVLDASEHAVLGRHCIALDVRAHGASPDIGAPGDFSLDSLADEIAAQVSAQTDMRPDTEPTASAPLTLLGISMGAAIALRIALRGLLPVSHAVFVRPAFGSTPLPQNLTAFPLIAQLLHDTGAEAGAERFTHTAAYRAVVDASPLGGAGLLTQFAAPDAVARAVRLMEIPRNRAYRDVAELRALADRGVQSLVVGTPRDPVHPLALAEEWAAGLGTPLVTVPARDAGQRTQTAALRSAVADWLAATAPDAAPAPAG